MDIRHIGSKNGVILHILCKFNSVCGIHILPHSLSARCGKKTSESDSDRTGIRNFVYFYLRINLALAFELGAALENEGYAVVYTRTEDKLLYTEEENVKGIRKISDLKNRCKIAAEYPNAMFLSIHMNSYTNPKYSGLQVYYSKGNEGSFILANSIQTSVKESVDTKNERMIKEGKGMYVLENVTNPAVLIECGFLTNPEECEKLSKKEYRKQLSLAIVCGIIEYEKTLKW
jgi:N-acetylmuramoyl-L-alanine amidase